MKFKPVTKKYDYSSETLSEQIPPYIQTSISDWIFDILRRESFYIPADYSGPAYIDSVFINRINVLFREIFPREWSNFIDFLFEDNDRSINFLAFCLQNIVYPENANRLEKILSDSGSAWAVLSTIAEAQSYQKGVFDIVRRVPDITKEVSQIALDNEILFRDAWIACYSRNPDYEKTVTKSVDVLEGMFRDKYFPKDSKPVLTKFIKSIQESAELISYKGDTLINPKSLPVSMLEKFITVRGQHTKGTGRLPTKEEAEFVLHYSIFLWNIFR